MTYNTIRKLLHIALFLVAISFQLIAQTKVNQAQALQYYKEAKAKGMSDEEIEKMALANGLSAEDLLLLKQGLSSTVGDEIVDDYVRESASQRQVSQTSNVYLSKPDTDSSPGGVFGANFFSSGAVTFEPNLQIPTPINYIVGPGDEILVDISGNAVKNYKMMVSPEGTVNLANFPPLYVSGLTMEEAQARINSKLRTAYAGPGIHTNITLGKIRSIRITVTGESAKPGTYTLPSLATAFHGLYVSGGPNSNGTMRQIEVIRNNRSVKTIDFYKFLVNGDVGDNIMLEDQDIIFIRPAQTLVSIEGEVKRPGTYEAKENEKLSSLISYAGGFKSDAYSSVLSFQRNTGKEYEIGQVNSDAFATFSLREGDKFSVGRILSRFTNRVSIRGAVFRAGDYPINDQIKTVSQLIRAAEGVTDNAFLTRALLYRQNQLLEPEVLPIDLRKLLEGQTPDIDLRRDDVLEIKAIQDLKEENQVSVLGEVLKPGTYLFRNKMTIGDLIFEAGGYTFGAVPHRVEIARRLKNGGSSLPSGQNVEIFQIELGDSLEISSSERDFPLEPFDQVFIRKSPRYETQKTFAVLGQVNYPGSYTVRRSVERISDAIERTGGLKESAYLSAAQFRRRGEPVALDLNSILKNPNQPANLLLQAGDTLLIPEKLETVKISGAVLNPSMINYDQSHSTKDYLAQAGGFLSTADRRNIYVTHANGITDRTKKFLFFKSYPKVAPGSLVVVPQRETDPNKQSWSRGERVMLISSLTTVGVTLVRVLQEIWTK
jgi:polysaccharide export outer membrane protein